MVNLANPAQSSLSAAIESQLIADSLGVAKSWKD
jgi:hypothetical protein